LRLSAAADRSIRLCEKKKEKKNCAQRRQAAKPVRRGGKSYRADHNFFAALRLCAKKNPPRRTRSSAGQALRLGEKKKKRIARKDAKPQRPPEGRQARWNHASLEMIKNQLKVWVNPKAKLHCIKVHSLGD
jgi:hypothetical protein